MAGSIAPFKRLLIGYQLDVDSGCWNWSGHKFSNGYGALKVFGRMRLAHRFSYELHKGEIPNGMEIMHQCDNKICVNPDHLKIGTHAENMQEAKERNRMRSGDNHPMRIMGNPRKGINNKQSKPVRVLGKLYGSMNEAERSLNLGSGTVGYWIKTNSPKAAHITKEEYIKNV